jgi:hypothetical protein
MERPGLKNLPGRFSRNLGGSLTSRVARPKNSEDGGATTAHQDSIRTAAQQLPFDVIKNRMFFYGHSFQVIVEQAQKVAIGA